MNAYKKILLPYSNILYNTAFYQGCSAILERLVSLSGKPLKMPCRNKWAKVEFATL